MSCQAVIPLPPLVGDPVCDALTRRANAIQNRDGCSFDTAWNRARAERGEASVALLSNREFVFDPAAPIEILRAGEFEHSESGLIQVFDTPGMNTMVAGFAAQKATPNFPGLIVDLDHSSCYQNRSSEAAGWITDLQRDGARLMATADWTKLGEDAVRTGRYRLLSPTFAASDMEHLGGNRVRPLKLHSVALTNTPNLKGLTPISNRNAALAGGGTSASPAAVPSRPPAPAIPFDEAVRRTETLRNRGFSEARDFATRRVIFLQMARRQQLANRAASDPFCSAPDQVKAWEQIQRQAAAVSDRVFRKCFSEDDGNTPGRRLYRAGAQNIPERQFALNAMNGWLRDNPAATSEDAWQWFRGVDPVNWAYLCVALAENFLP